MHATVRSPPLRPIARTLVPTAYLVHSTWPVSAYKHAASSHLTHRACHRSSLPQPRVIHRAAQAWSRRLTHHITPPQH